MKSLAINFSGDAPVLDFNSLTYDIVQPSVQNILVNLGTRTGSDPFDSTRGTGLLNYFAQSGYVSLTSAQHASNFAALDIKRHFNATKNAEDQRLSSITVQVTPVNTSRLRIQLSLDFSDEELSTTVTL